MNLANKFYRNRRSPNRQCFIRKRHCRFMYLAIMSMNRCAQQATGLYELLFSEWQKILHFLN